jgi:hypothetical protein
MPNKKIPEFVDLYARRVFTKYKMHLDGWAFDMQKLTELVQTIELEPLGSATGTLILLSDGTTTKTIEDIATDDALYPTDPLNPTVVAQNSTNATLYCIEFVTDNSRTLTLSAGQLIMERDGGAIRADELEVGMEIATITGNEVVITKTEKPVQTVWKITTNTVPAWHSENGIWVWSASVNANTLLITSSSPLTAGHVGWDYSEQLTSTGGWLTARTWSVDSGSLPTGLSMDAAGLISGTPTAANTFTHVAKVVDARSAFDTKSLAITIGGTYISDDFNRADNPINTGNSDWANFGLGGTPNIVGNLVDFQVNSRGARSTASQSSAAHQFVEIKYVSQYLFNAFGNASTILTLMASGTVTSNLNQYELQFGNIAPFTLDAGLVLYRRVAGALTQLAILDGVFPSGSYPRTTTPGSVVRLEAVVTGSSVDLTVKVGGVTKITYSDTNAARLTSGKAGLQTGQIDGAGFWYMAVDDFKCGSY